MAQKTKIRKDRKIVVWFLQLFPEYREIQESCSVLLNNNYQFFQEIKELKKTVKKKDDAQDLSAAIIRSNKKDSDSDFYLIESLNRYIKTLETKVNYQTELLKELKERLEVLHSAYINK